MAIHLRAVWSFSGVQDRYIHVEAAGDQYVGRTITGLPVLDSKFASSLPYFKTTPVNLHELIQQNFVNLQPSLYRVAEFCLASLLYHRDYLFSALSQNHPLFNCAIFRNATQMTSLAEQVTVSIGNMHKDENIIQNTGIPPHVSLLWIL